MRHIIFVIVVSIILCISLSSCANKHNDNKIENRSDAVDNISKKHELSISQKFLKNSESADNKGD